MQTVKSIITEMVNAARQNQPMSPGWWVDRAILLAALWGNFKDDMTKAEMAYNSEVSALIEEGMSSAAAKRKVEGESENYKQYKYFKGRDEIISEMIKLAKKRGSIEEVI